MTSDNLTSALLVVLFINMMLFLGQFAVLELSVAEGINADSVNTVYNANNSILCEFESSNCNPDVAGAYILDESNPSGLLPDDDSISADTGNPFTDLFSTAKGWLTETLGLDYLASILGAPGNFLKAINVPDAVAFSLGALWYGITLFLIVSWLLAR